MKITKQKPAGTSPSASNEGVQSPIKPAGPLIRIETICENCKNESTRDFKRVWYMCKNCAYFSVRPKTYEELK